MKCMIVLKDHAMLQKLRTIQDEIKFAFIIFPPSNTYYYPIMIKGQFKVYIKLK